MADVNVTVTVPSFITATATNTNAVTVAVANPSTITATATNPSSVNVAVNNQASITVTTSGLNTVSVAVTNPAPVTVSASVGNSGDMMKSVYDTDNDGVVDNAEALGGVSASSYIQTGNASWVDLTDGGTTTLHSHSAGAGTVTSIATTAPITGGTITGSGTIAISAATTLAAGSMSASDKAKLDGIETGAEVNNISDANATDLTDGGQTSLHTHADGGGTVTSIATTAPITGGTITGSGTIGIDAATTLAAGSMSAGDKTKLDGLVTNATHTGDVTGSGALTIANKVTMTGTAPVSVSGTPTVIAGSAVAISMSPASNGVNGYMTGTYATKLDGIASGAQVNNISDVNATDLTDGGSTNLHSHANDHARQHSITSTSDHTSTATSGQMLKADANGLPVNATNTDAQVSAAVTASHAAVTVADTTTIDLTLTGQQISAAAIFGTTATTVAQGNHTHTGVYEPADATIVKTGNANWVDLTDGGATTLHSHAASGILSPANGGTGIDNSTKTLTIPETGQAVMSAVGATVIGQIPFYSSVTGGITSDSLFIWNNTSKLLGLGITPVWPLHLSKVYTDAATESYGLFSQTVYNVTAAAAGTYRANYLQAITSATSDNQGTVIAAYFNARGRGTGGTTTNLSSLIGATAIDAGSAAAYTNVNALQFTVSHAGTGTVTNMNGSSVTATLATSGGAVDGNVSSAIAYAATISNTATAATPGVITNAYLFRANPPTGTAAITTMYGYYVGNMGRAGITTAYGINVQSQTGATNNYAIYTNAGLVRFGDVVLLVQATTAGAPAYRKGGLYFDTTLNKLRVGGATAWETVTSS